MRFMTIVKASGDSEAGVMPGVDLMASMPTYHEALQNAGVLLDGSLEWTKRFPNPVGEGREAEIEVRQLLELEDFEPSGTLDRFRDMDAFSRT